MAINFGYGKETLFASTDLMSFGKAFSRMAAQPLDMYEVWYDYDALVAYAANTDSSTATAYVGQKVAYIDADNKVFHYSIEADGSLKEIGTSPVGDESSITVDENGTVSLKGVGTLVFEREVEGEKVEVKFQPLMTKNGLVWVEPSTITVEDLKDLIDALDGRVEALEGRADALESAVGKAAKPESAEGADDAEEATGLFKALDDEVARAQAAEKALDDAIKAIDFVDENELADAIKDFETKENVKTVADNLAKYVEDNDKALADVKATADAAAVATEVEAALALKADKTEVKDLKDRVDAFLTGEGTEAALDSLQELIKYIDEHDDTDIAGILGSIEALEEKVVLGTYVDGEETKEYATVKDYVEAAITALKIGDYAKAADLVEVAGKVTALEGKVDVDKVSTAISGAVEAAITAEVARSDAKAKELADAAQEAAAADAKSKADKALEDAKKYADDNKVAKVDGFGLLSKEDQDKLNKLTLEDGNLSISGSVEAGSVKNLDTWLTTNRDTVAGLYPAADATKLAGVAAGAQVNVLEGVQVDGTDLTIDANKKVNIVLAPYAKQADLNTVSAQADKGVADAATAQSKANSAYELASANKTEAERIAPIVAGHTTSITDHESRIGVVEGTSTNHEGRIATLEGKASANEGNITSLQTTVGEHTTAIATINSTLTNHDGRITTNAGNITNLQKALTGYETEGSVKTAIDAAAAKGTAAQGTADSALAKANENAGLIAGLTTASNTNTQNIAKNAEDIGKNAEAIAENTRLIGVNDAAIKENTRLIGVNAAAIEAHQTSVAGEIQRVDGLVSGLDTRMGTAEGKISTLESQVTNAMHFRGISSQDPTITTDLNGTQQGPAIEGVTSYAAGDVVIYNHLEYVFDGSKWSVLGDESSYALKNNVYTRSEIDSKVVTINESIASAYANAKSEAISDAKSYTDTEVGKLNETVAENYNELTEHANDVAGEAETNAKAYADSILAAALSWQDMPALDAE